MSQPFFLPLFTGVRGRVILRSSPYSAHCPQALDRPVHTSALFPGSVAFVSATGNMEHMIRVLVTLWPQMYRQTVALSIQRDRPGLVDVRIAPPEAMEEEIASFRPHLLVYNDASADARIGAAPIPEAALEAVPHRFEVLYSDGMDVRLSADGHLTVLRDASVEDLLGAVDAAGSFADQEQSPG
jgi:hypothetical protein